MKTLSILALPLAALAFATACPTTDGSDDETGDTGFDTSDTSDTSVEIPDFRIAAASWGCTGDGTDARTDDVWYYYVKTDAWMADAALSIVETGDASDARWAETDHPMAQLAFDEAGTWDEFDVSLGGVEAPSGVVKGSKTLFSCKVHGADSLTWKIKANKDGGGESDCVSFGHQPTAFINGISANSVAGGAIAADSTCSNGGAATNGQATLD